MENNSKILDELKGLSPLLAQLQNKSPYVVSFTYFNTLAEDIAEKIKSGAEPYWYFTKENPYSTPADYFETLSAIIVQKIGKGVTKNEVFEEMEEISPLLNTISKKVVYTVPNGYLEEAKWKNSNMPVKKGKVVSFFNVKTVTKYAVAAVVTGLLATGMFLFTGKQNNNATQANNSKAASEVKNLSEQEIIDFLKTTSPAENIVSNVNSSNIKDNDIKSSVSKMSDKEIQQFLQENGEQVEM